MMKRFKFLGALFIGLIGLISFGYCGSITFTGHFNGSYTKNNTLFAFSTNNSTTYGDSYSNVTLSCSVDGINLSMFSPSLHCSEVLINGYMNSDSLSINSNTFVFSRSNIKFGMYYIVAGSNINGSFDWSCTLNGDIIKSNSCDCPVCEECSEQYTSEECQSEYSLMPISSCDSEYCELNGMCGVSGTGLSELYINGINHLSSPEINLLIPLEYQWDYLYTGDSLNINISGYNVDYDYIDNIIKTQRSTPNDEDLNNIVSGLIPLFVPGLVLIVFIIFIFRFIKKIF